jgi:hypothetical protein
MYYLLIDTDILIDISNNDSKAKARLQKESQNTILAISTITIMELVVGCRNKFELQSLNLFLAQFHTLNLNQNVSVKAIELMKNYFLSHGLMIPDALIAATAICNNISLLSKNQRDYRFMTELNLLSYRS